MVAKTEPEIILNELGSGLDWIDSDFWDQIDRIAIQIDC